MEHLKKCEPSEWWNEVKKLSGRSLASAAQNDMQSLQHLYESIDQIGLANIINEAFLSPMFCFTPLPVAFPCTTFSNYSENRLVVSVESVRKKLSKLNPCKANGPDNIPGWLLKENADILAGPVSDILRQRGRVVRALGLHAAAPGSNPALTSLDLFPVVPDSTLPRFVNSQLVASCQLGFLIVFLLSLNCFFHVVKSGVPVN